MLLRFIVGKPIVIEIKPIIASALHDSATLSITHYSNDETNHTIKWYKTVNKFKEYISHQNNKVIYENEVTDVQVLFYNEKLAKVGMKSKLTIIDVSTTDVGDYEVEIINSIGATESRTRLAVIGILFDLFSKNYGKPVLCDLKYMLGRKYVLSSVTSAKHLTEFGIMDNY